MAQFIQPDIPGAVNRGLQFAQQQRMNPLQIDAANLAIQGQEQKLEQGEQNMQFGRTKQKALEQQIAQRTSDQKNKDFVNSALRLQTLPDDQKLQALLENKQTIINNGGDTSDTDAGIKLAQAGNFEELNQGINNIITSGERQGIITAAQGGKGFTLSEGQQRFDASGNPLASVAPKRSANNTATALPPVLLEGLDPEIAPKAEAAFNAAGGGKDGLKAFNETVDKGSERQRRAASPAILKQSFPQASVAETKQLQAAMDSAKTTESGLKEANKVRVEQRRIKKAKIFQGRAVELLTDILDNDQLDDVIGSIEGSIDTRIFSDVEAGLIADIQEAGNILTADNLKLMSGVLSETDIKILQNLSGGALNRKRTEERFRTDVTELRDRLNAEQVVTVDEIDEQRTKASNPEVPPSGRQGGELRVDGKGNKAFVFPDGTFEELD